MNDEPTTINIIISEHAPHVDIIFDLSTGPETRRVGIFRAKGPDLELAIGLDWKGWFTGNPERAVKQYSNIKTQLKDGFTHFLKDKNEEDIRLLSKFLWQHDRPPTFNEWEKEKLMQDLQ